MSGYAQRLARTTVQRLRTMLEHIADHHGTPELLVALTIMAGWGAAGFQSFGFWAVVAAIVLGWALHGVAVETGGYGWLWLATGLVLLYIAFARNSLLADINAIWMAAAGATALAYNEAVRSNHWRRRKATVGSRLFPTVAMTTLVAALLGIAGVGVATYINSDGATSSWWQLLAAAVLFALAVGLLFTPTLRVTESSRQRWTPGTRLPAPPKGGDAARAGHPQPNPPNLQ